MIEKIKGEQIGWCVYLGDVFIGFFLDAAYMHGIIVTWQSKGYTCEPVYKEVK